MKRIENRKIYHNSNFHKRFFDIKFERELILIRCNADDDDVHKKIMLKSIVGCNVHNEGEVYNSNSSRNLPRSRSLLTRLGRKGDDEVCQWNYNFVLETIERNMELYAPTRKDRDNWVRMFKLIIDMNKQQIGTSTMSPFVYEMQRKYLVVGKKEPEDEYLTERESSYQPSEDSIAPKVKSEAI